MSVIKRSKSNSLDDLIVALDKFVVLLEQQREMDAAEDLRVAREMLSTRTESDIQQKALRLIQAAFEDEHELIAYTHHRQTDDWTEREELATASSRVLSLTQRLLSPSST